MFTRIALDHDIATQLLNCAHDQDGDVAAPGGYFAVVEVPEEVLTLADFEEMFADAEGLEKDTSVPVAGWYLMVQNELGQINALHTLSEADALAEFESRQSVFHQWQDEALSAA